MDMDGKHEVIITDYNAGNVIVYEMDVANNVFDLVWTSAIVEEKNLYGSYNPRTVGVGDLDGDGKHEIFSLLVAQKPRISYLRMGWSDG